MRVVMTSGTTLYNFVMREMQKIGDVDLLIMAYGTLPEISYEAEIEGEENLFEDICRISQNLDCVLIAGCETDLYGLHHKSVAVAEKGRLINVTDMVNIGGNEYYTPGIEYNIYRTNAGKIGLLIDNDIYSFNSEVLKNAGCDYIVSVIDGTYSDSIESVVKDNARNQCDILCACRDYSFVAGRHGYLRQGGQGFFQFDFLPDK